MLGLLTLIKSKSIKGVNKKLIKINWNLYEIV